MMKTQCRTPKSIRRLTLSITSLAATLLLAAGANPAIAQTPTTHPDVGTASAQLQEAKLEGDQSKITPKIETVGDSGSGDLYLKDSEPTSVFAPPESDTPEPGPTGISPWIIPEEEPTMSIQLNPGTIAACNIGLGETVIEKFATRYSGTISLKCGNSSAGYVHIRTNHQSQWKTVTPSGNWDDFMVYATRQVVSKPSMSRMQTSTKRCYVAPIEIWRTVNGKPTYWKTTYPRVAVSQNNKLVITSFPTGRNQC